MPTSRLFLTLAVAGAIAAAGCAQDADDNDMGDDMDAPANVVDTPAPAATPTGTAPQVDPSMLPEGVTQAMIDSGQTIFTQAGFCYTCHGQDGAGSQIAPNLTDDTWIHVEGGDYEGIVQLIMSGVPEPVEYTTPMPARGNAPLTDEQVRQVAAYVWSLSHGS